MDAHNINMIELNAKLTKIYDEVSVCELVKNKKINDETIKEFKKLLMSSRPKGNAEVVAYGVLRHLFENAPKFGNTRYFTGKLACYMLWAPNSDMLYHFGIKGIIKLNATINNVEVSKESDRQNKFQKEFDDATAEDLQEFSMKDDSISLKMQKLGMGKRN
jgi:hypothetical protein